MEPAPLFGVETRKDITFNFESDYKKKKHQTNLMFSIDFGSPTWARTRDLRINSPSLYRLSYRGIEKKIIFNSFDAVKLFLICHFLNGVLTASSRFLNYSVFLIVVGIFAAFQLCFRDRCCFLCLIRIFQKLNEDFPFPDHGQFAACTFLDGFRAFAQ